MIPDSHRDLVEAPPVAALTTMLPSGYPQTSVVWCDFDGTCVRVNTMRGFCKHRNMRRDPTVALLCTDPADVLRYLELGGTVVEMTEIGARRHLDELASRYVGRPVRYFGDVVDAGLADTEIPVLCRILPRRVVARDWREAEPGPAADRWSPPPPLPRPPPSGPVVALPESHLDLLARPLCGVLATVDPGGRPRSSLVWVDHDGECLRVNTTLERRKGRDLVADPRAGLLVVDPDDTSRFLEVRGDVELVRTGAIEHLDQLTRIYTRHPAFYGHVYPLAQRDRETRVICRLHPRRIVLDAIHRARDPKGNVSEMAGSASPTSGEGRLPVVDDLSP